MVFRQVWLKSHLDYSMYAVRAKEIVLRASKLVKARSRCTRLSHKSKIDAGETSHRYQKVAVATIAWQISGALFRRTQSFSKLRLNS